MTTTGERSVVDTNILVYAASPAVPQYQASRTLLESEEKLCVSSQVIAEFYSVVTNPRRVTVPFTPAEARAFIRAVLPRLDVLPVMAAVMVRWLDLAEKHGVTGADVFDLQLVATMLENGVRRIYTYNRDDFELNRASLLFARQPLAYARGSEQSRDREGADAHLLRALFSSRA